MKSTPEQITFWIPGIPAPGGSKRFVGLSKKTGRAILVDDAGERNKNWRSICATVGAQAMSGKVVFEGPLYVEFNFRMPRPKGHFGSGKNAANLKASAPAYPVTKPDVLKLSRSTEDALTGIVWRDDCQTVTLLASKWFAENGKCGCEVLIRPRS
jgi:Holliday junction resolvase RusA-like endonuclease